MVPNDFGGGPREAECINGGVSKSGGSDFVVEWEDDEEKNKVSAHDLDKSLGGVGAG